MKGRILDRVMAAERDHRSVALATNLTTGQQLLLDGEHAEGDLALDDAVLDRVREVWRTGLTTTAMSVIVIVMQIGMWFGYVTFGFVSDAVGRKKTYITYLLVASALLFVFGTTRTPLLLLILGPFVAFFGTGYYTGFAAVTAETYETKVRATAQGFTYNAGRIVSAAAPFTVGSLAQTHGFGAAFAVGALSFLLAAFFWIWIPETKGRRLAAEN